MNENENNMNLSGMVGGGTPVYATSSTINTNVVASSDSIILDASNATIQANNINSTLVANNFVSDTSISTGVSNSSQPQENTTNVPETKTENKEKVAVIKDTFEVPVSVLKEYIGEAKKVAVNDGARLNSQVIGLRLDENGITFATGNSVIEYKRVYSDIRFTKSFSACVDSKLFSDFVASIDDAFVVLDYDEQYRTLLVKAQRGEYKFPHIMDNVTNTEIDLSLSYNITDENQLVPVDYNKLVRIINTSKPVRDIKDSKTIPGVYLSNISLGGGALDIIVQEGIEAFAEKPFLLPSNYCFYISALSFDASKFKVGFILNPKDQVFALVCTDGSLTICGGVVGDAQLNKAVGEKFWNTDLSTAITADSLTLLRTIDRMDLFFHTQDDFKTCKFTIEGNSLHIAEGISTAAKEFVPIENPMNVSITLALPLTKIQTLLKYVKASKVSMMFDPTNSSYVIFQFEDMKWVIAAVG